MKNIFLHFIKDKELEDVDKRKDTKIKNDY